MQALLKKETIVNKQSILINLVLIIIFSLALGVFGMILSYGIFMSCYQPISNESNESSINSDIFVNSLPVTREKIVLSKYLFSIVTGIGYLSVVFLISAFIPIFELITIKEVVVGIAIVCIFLSVYFPLKYLVRQNFFIISSLGFWVILVALAYSIYNQGDSFDYFGMYYAYTTYTTLQVVIISVLISCAALVVSFRYSSRLYKKVDLK